MAPLTSLSWHRWTLVLLLALHLQASAAAMVTSALTKALAKPKPVVVHLYDPKPADLKEYALADVSIACRDAGTTGILTMPELVKGFADEQEDARGSFPGPVPVLVDCGLEEQDWRNQSVWSNRSNSSPDKKRENTTKSIHGGQ